MADYSKTTNFAVKDGLTSGIAAKKIVGSEFDVEFNNLQTAVAFDVKAGLAKSALVAIAVCKLLNSTSNSLPTIFLAAIPDVSPSLTAKLVVLE